MESTGLSSVMFSGYSPGMLSLEMPQSSQNPQNPQNPMQFHHHPVVPYAGNGGGGSGDQQLHQSQSAMKPPHPYASASSKPKQLSPLSDEDDLGSGSGSGLNPEDGAGSDGKRKFSPWQRMKWTDTMVRLLIMAVFYIGDEAGHAEPTDSGKRKASTGGGGGGGGLQQKKGKWKSVSRAMMEKGFYVSPQQCEDKFNDLNKRYKRVNDILGKGTACRVVENQSLLETMDLPSKLKEEVKKLLNSKHLFFREMCAYHNSCGHLTVNTNPGSSVAAAGASDQTQQPQPQTQQPHPQMQQQLSYLHGEDESWESSESSESGSEEESAAAMPAAAEEGVRRVREEVGRVEEDGTKSWGEKREWMRRKAAELEEKRVEYEWEALEMEKQRVKWLRFSGKKEREMEKAMLQNQRRRLENQRMVLILRRKEMELKLQHQHQHQHQHQQQPQTISSSSGKRVDPGPFTG